MSNAVLELLFLFPPQINTIPGLLIFRFQAPLCFVSSYVFRSRLEQAAQMDCTEWKKKNEGILKKIITKVTLNVRLIDCS